MSKSIKAFIIFGILLGGGSFVFKSWMVGEPRKHTLTAEQMKERADDYAKKRAAYEKTKADAELAKRLTVSSVAIKSVEIPENQSTSLMGDADAMKQELLAIEKRHRELELAEAAKAAASASGANEAAVAAATPVVEATPVELPRYAPSLQVFQVRLQNQSWFTLRISKVLSEDMKMRLQSKLESVCLISEGHTADCASPLLVADDLQARLLNCDASKSGSLALVCGNDLDCLDLATSKFALVSGDKADPKAIFAKLEVLKPTKDECATKKVDHASAF